MVHAISKRNGSVTVAAVIEFLDDGFILGPLQLFEIYDNLHIG